jgi:hypothetical protein
MTGRRSHYVTDDAEPLSELPPDLVLPEERLTASTLCLQV